MQTYSTQAAKFLRAAAPYMGTDAKPVTRWPSINLNNLTVMLTKADIETLVPQVHEASLTASQAKVDRYKELKAPPIIMTMAETELAKAKIGKGPIEAILNRALKKLNKA